MIPREQMKLALDLTDQPIEPIKQIKPKNYYGFFEFLILQSEIVQFYTLYPIP